MFEKNYDRIQNVNLNLHFPMYKNLVFSKFLSIRVRVLFCFGKECHKFRNNSMGREREHVDKNFEWDKKCRIEVRKGYIKQINRRLLWNVKKPHFEDDLEQLW